MTAATTHYMQRTLTPSADMATISCVLLVELSPLSLFSGCNILGPVQSPAYHTALPLFPSSDDLELKEERALFSRSIQVPSQTTTKLLLRRSADRTVSLQQYATTRAVSRTSIVDVYDRLDKKGTALNKLRINQASELDVGRSDTGGGSELALFGREAISSSPNK